MMWCPARPVQVWEVKCIRRMKSWWRRTFKLVSSVVKQNPRVSIHDLCGEISSFLRRVGFIRYRDLRLSSNCVFLKPLFCASSMPRARNQLHDWNRSWRTGRRFKDYRSWRLSYSRSHLCLNAPRTHTSSFTGRGGERPTAEGNAR